MAQEDIPSVKADPAQVIPDSNAPPSTRNRLTPEISYGARLELELSEERNFDLNGARDDHLVLFEPRLRGAASYDPSANFQAFLDLELSKQFALDEPRSTDRDASLELKQIYAFWKHLWDDRLDVKLGRQKFKDPRKWLYDEDLDAVRPYVRFQGATIEFSASRQGLWDEDLIGSDNEDKIDNYIVYASFPILPKADLAAYWILRDSKEPDEDENPIFLGLQSSGELTKRLDYWVELAHVRGRDGRNKIRGWGFDVGGTYEVRVPYRTFLTLAYAYGSGDANRNDGEDRNFRQTDLQDNEDRWGGVTRFKYYGELFDPELSNLEIFTVGVGMRPVSRASVDVVYHLYRQNKAANRIRDSDLDIRPNGLSEKLGSEVDLVVGYRQREGSRLTLELVLGYFMPDDAFPGSAADAYFGNVQFKMTY